MGQISKTIEQVCNLLVYISSIILFGLMAITVVDVVGRFFGVPVPGATGLIGSGLAVAIALAFPVVNWRGANIVLGLFAGNEHSLWEKFRRTLVAVICAITIITLAYVLFFHAKSAAEYQDVIGYLEIPLAPFIYTFSAMSVVTAGIVILNLLGIYRSVPLGEDHFEGH